MILYNFPFIKYNNNINCCLFFFLRCFAKFFYFFTIDHINLIITIYCRISFFFQTIDNFSFHL